MTLELRGIELARGGKTILDGVSLTVADGEIVCLTGPSGSGKTTLLRVIAGLAAPDAGTVVFAGADLRDVPVHRRGFGLVFQDHALFPHRDVAANVAFGLRMQGVRRRELASRVAAQLELVGLADAGRRDVTTLSGGEQQRVALARALAPRPRLLLLDEPLASLDRELRDRLALDLRRILREVGISAIHVTHDLAEAATVGDRTVALASLVDG